MSNASSARRGRYRQAARDAAFLLRLWSILLPAFLVVVPLIALGAGTAVLGVGVPVLVLGLSVSSRFAEIGRRAVADVDSSDYVPGHYRRPGAGAPRPPPAPAWSGTSTTGPSSASCAWAWTWPGPSGRPPGTRGPRRRSSTGPSPRPARPSTSCAASRAAAPRRCWSTELLAAALAEVAARGELVLEPDVVAQVMRRGRRNDPIETLAPRERDPRRLPVSRVLPPGLAPRGIDLLFFHGVQRRLRAGARSEAGCPSGQWELTVNQPRNATGVRIPHPPLWSSGPRAGWSEPFLPGNTPQ